MKGLSTDMSRSFWVRMIRRATFKNDHLKVQFSKKKKKKDARTVEFYQFWLSGNIKGWWIYLLLNLNTQDELMTWQGFVAGQICHGSGNNYKTASSPEIKKAGSGYTE